MAGFNNNSVTFIFLFGLTTNKLFTGSESDNVEKVVDNKDSETRTKEKPSDISSDTQKEDPLDDKSIAPTECKIPKTEDNSKVDNTSNGASELAESIDIKVLYTLYTKTQFTDMSFQSSGDLQ